MYVCAYWHPDNVSFLCRPAVRPTFCVSPTTGARVGRAVMCPCPTPPSGAPSPAPRTSNLTSRRNISVPEVSLLVSSDVPDSLLLKGILCSSNTCLPGCIAVCSISTQLSWLRQGDQGPDQLNNTVHYCIRYRFGL